MKDTDTARESASDPSPLSAESAVQKLPSREVSPATQRAYSYDWARWVTWCAVNDYAAIPATAELLAEYAAHLAVSGRAVTTIDRALAAIATAHRNAEELVPATALARACARSQVPVAAGARRAAPVTVSVLRAMVAVCNGFTAIGTRDRALLVLGFALGARRSELVSLDLADMVETPAGLRVTIRPPEQSTIGRPRTIVVPHGAQAATCPVRKVRAWRELLTEHGRADGPLLVRIDRHGRVGHTANGRGSTDGRLSDRAVANVVRRTAQRAGLDPAACWAGHSLRRGMATETYRAGADLLHIARHGGWQDSSRALLANIEEPDSWHASPLTGVGL